MSTNFPEYLNPFKVFFMLGYALFSFEGVSPLMGHAHGGGGGERLEAGEFRTTPILTVE